MLNKSTLFLASALMLSLPPAQAIELGRFLHGFLIYHLGKIPKGREAALMLPP
jgi:hypothetical protein